MFDRPRALVMRTLAVGTIFAVSLATVAQACRQPPTTVERAVVVGGSWKQQECTGIGTNIGAVVDLKPGAYLAVRAAPNIKAEEIGRLQSGHGVDMCTRVTNKEWIGIVYSNDPDGDREDCRQTYRSEKPVPYRGPCNYGWVAARYLHNAAG
jgi:hypothetical protein